MSATTSLGGRLREVRQTAKASLRDMESLSGLNSGYLSQLEQGKITHPSPVILRKVADAYGVRFEDLLVWAGYATETSGDLPPRQAMALSTVASLGDPSAEELSALRAIVEILQQNRTATYSAPSDLALDEIVQAEIRNSVVALLREADAIGKRPTPLDEIRSAARLVESGELTLNPRDKASLVERFGHWVDLSWKRLQGALDFRSSTVWVRPDLHPMKQRFVASHEIGHVILPGHRETFAYVEDFSTLPPKARNLYEREANQAAVEILFQSGELTDEIDASRITLQNICHQSLSFGASLVATARYAAETSRKPVATAIAWKRVDQAGPLGRPHVYASKSFNATFGWDRATLPIAVHQALSCGNAAADSELTIADVRGNPHTATLETISSRYWSLVLVVPVSRSRRIAKRIAQPRG